MAFCGGGGSKVDEDSKYKIVSNTIPRECRENSEFDFQSDIAFWIPWCDNFSWALNGQVWKKIPSKKKKKTTHDQK